MTQGRDFNENSVTRKGHLLSANNLRTHLS